AIVLYAMNKVSWYTTRIYYQYSTVVHDRKGLVTYYLHGIPFAIGFTLMLAGVLFGAKWLQAVFAFTPLRIFGVLAYSLYLTHVAIMIVLSKLPGIQALDPARRFPMLLVAGTATSLALS